MKKIVLSFLALCFGSILSAQSIEEKYPTGKYKMAVSDMTFYIHIADNGRFVFQKQEDPDEFPDPEDPDSYQPKTTDMFGNFYMNGNEFRLEFDGIFSKQLVYFGNSNNVEKDKIRITLSDLTSSNFEFSLATGNYFDKKSMRSFPDSFLVSPNNDSYDTTIVFFSKKADSLYIANSRPYYDRIFCYALPDNINDIFIQESDDAISGFPSVISMKRGENSNELIMFEDTDKYLNRSFSLFYIGEPDIPSTDRKDPTDIPGYKFHRYDKTYLLNFTDSDDEQLTEELPIKAIADTIPVYTSYKEAVKAIQNNNRFLILYHDEVPAGTTCKGKGIKRLCDRIQHYENVGIFNERFVLFQAADQDIHLFEKYGITHYPATVILSPEERPVFLSSEKCITDLFAGYLYQHYYGIYGVYDLLTRKYAETVLLPEINSEKKPKKEFLIKYLNSLSSLNYFYLMSDILSDMSESEKENWNIALTRNDFVPYLDLLIDDHLKKENPDTANIAYITDKINFLNNTTFPGNYDPSYAYPFIKNGTLSPGYAYLIDTYENYLPKDKELKGNLFTYINTQAYYNITGHDESADSIFSFIIRRAPSIKDLEVLFASAVGSNPGSDRMNNKLINEFIDTYADSYVNSDDLYRKIEGSFDKLYEDQPFELLFILQNSGYIDYSTSNFRNEISAYDNELLADKNSLKVAFEKVIAGYLNMNAWIGYLYASPDDESFLTRSLSRSEASLKLQPDNAYYLDTKARLLYRLGRKQEAVMFQEKANERIEQMNDPVTRRGMNDALIRMKREIVSE